MLDSICCTVYGDGMTTTAALGPWIPCPHCAAEQRGKYAALEIAIHVEREHPKLKAIR
jgi:hypothetical protein